MNPKANNKSHLGTSVRPSLLRETVPTPHSVPSPEVIRARAYELYTTRGCEPGLDEQDWIRAEQEILKLERQRGLNLRSGGTSVRLDG